MIAGNATRNNSKIAAQKFPPLRHGLIFEEVESSMHVCFRVAVTDAGCLHC